MSIVTTYHCDRCGVESENAVAFRMVGLSEDLQQRRFPVVSEQGMTSDIYVAAALWCVPCLIELKLRK